MMMWYLLLLATAATAAVDTSFEAFDDECNDPDSGCDPAVRLLQRQSRKLSEEKDEWAGSCQAYGCRQGYHSWMKCQCNAACERYGNCCGDFQSKCVESYQGSCANYGCGTSYVASNSCQCNDLCGQYGNCCSDYGTACSKATTTRSSAATTTTTTNKATTTRTSAATTMTWTSTATTMTTTTWTTKESEETTTSESESSDGSSPSPSTPANYRVVWRAQGESFFSKFNFLWEDPNHGSAQYLLPPQAEEEGVVEATSHWAVLRAGRRSPKYQYKRMTARIESKESWKNFLSIIKFSHVPYGCGVWPALFTLAAHGEWPNGGELDMLEYVNLDQSKASFHAGGSCTLDPSKVNEYGSMPDRNDMNYDCVTSYPDRLGCAPNKWMKSSESWAHSPGVIATQWTENFIKLFYIPEQEIPEDIRDETPKPEDWNQWLFSYYPFSGTNCSIVAQKLMMQINFCGDWAGKVWSADGNCNWRVPNCRSVDPLKEYAPEEDCCTEWIWDPDNRFNTNQYLQERAYFNISYIKVFQ